MTLYECRVMQGYIIQVSDLVKAGCKPNKFHSPWQRLGVNIRTLYNAL